MSDFLIGAWAATSRKFIYATSASGINTQFTDEVETQAGRMAAAGIELTIWDEEEVSELLRDKPELVDDFFGRPWVAAFCGADVAEGLGSRLDGEQVERLRAGLRTTYAAAFGLADPGIVAPSATTTAGVPLAERFVNPDLRPFRAPDAYPTAWIAPLSTDAGGMDSAEEAGAQTPHDKFSLIGEPVPRRGSLDGDWLGFARSPGGAAEASRTGTTPADEWLGNASRQIVIGEPGAGKSTLLRHLVLDLLSEQPVWSGVAERWDNRLPVWLPFHFFTQRVTGTSGHEASVVQAIRAWLEQHDAGRAWPLIEQALDDDRLLLIVDGLDEWAEVEAGEYAAAALERFATARSIALVVSSRPYGLQRLKLGPGWSYARISPLSPAQQRSVARTCLAHGLDEEARSQEAIDTTLTTLMSEIQASADLRAMAGVPLFLVLLARLRLATGARLPDRRFDVFERAIELLIGEHPSGRRVAAAVTMSRPGLRDRHLRAVLAHVAFQAQTRGDFGTIREQRLRQDLIAALRDPEVLALDQSSAIREADAIANVAEGEFGVLVRQGPREVSFIHRCLQEQLAAEHVNTRLSREEQRQLLLDRLGDIRWREVLLGVMWLIPLDERLDLAEALAQRVADTPVGLQAAEMLAEIVFGPYDLPGDMSQDQAQFLANRIETHPVLSHRERLVTHFVTGIDTIPVRALVEERLLAWTGLTQSPTGSLVRELGQLSTDAATICGPLPVIVDALTHLDSEIVWTAAWVLADRLSAASEGTDEHTEVRTALRRILKSPTSAASVAAALAVLCLVWPDDEQTGRAVESYRSSSSGAVRMVSLAHLLGVLRNGLLDKSTGNAPTAGRLTDEERAWLHEQVSDRSAQGTHDGIKRVTVDAAARSNPETFAHVLKRIKEGSGPDIDSVWSVALSSFASEKRVAEVVAQQIAEQEQPLFHLGFGLGGVEWLTSAYGPENPHRALIAAAIETHLERFETVHREVELHALAAIDHGPLMRNALLHALAQSSVPHWPASALLNHFADDFDVMASLYQALTTDPVKAARLGSFAGRVLGHAHGRERLLVVLRALAETPGLQGQVPYDVIVSGLVECCSDVTDPAAREEFCAEALRLLPAQSRRGGDPLFDLAVRFYPCPSAKRILEQHAESADASHLPWLLFAYRDEPAANASLIERARHLLRVPPPSIRRAINELLSTDVAAPGFTMSCCASWADEASESVRSIASLAYHRALLSERARGNVSAEVWSDALARLGDAASSYGPDHQARRRAAWVGMCVIGDWSPIDSKVETIGENPDPVGIPIGDALSGPDEVLLDQLGRRWAELRDHFGAQLIARLSGLRATIPESTTWGYLSTVASGFPALDADVRSAVDADPQLLSDDAVIAWYATDQRRSQDSVTEVVARYISAEDNSRNAAVRIAQDPEFAGLDASQLIDLVAEHASAAAEWPGNAQLETLAVLQPCHPLVQRVWTEIAKLIGYGAKADDPAPDDRRSAARDGDELEELGDADRKPPHLQTYLAVAYSCIPSHDVGWLVERDLRRMAQHGGDVTFYEAVLVRHLRRRLRADPVATRSVHSVAVRKDLPVDVAAQISSLLATNSPGGVSVHEAIKDCLDRVAHQPFATLTRDIGLGATVSVQAAMLNAASASR